LAAGGRSEDLLGGDIDTAIGGHRSAGATIAGYGRMTSARSTNVVPSPKKSFSRKIAVPTSLDRINVLGGVVAIIGWSSEFQPGSELTILQNGESLRTLVVPHERQDVSAHYGERARGWGFRAYGVTKQLSASPGQIEIEFPSGIRIDCAWAATATPDDDPHGSWTVFRDEVNRVGGTVLEIGSRARSGNTVRDQFGPQVDYIGMDIANGPNVDVVGDAHDLAASISRKVDWVFSISTFEHLLMPWKVALSINSIMREGGKVYTQSHQTWPCHDEPWDYFRFSREAWAGLFNAHTGFEILRATCGEPVSILSRMNLGGPYLNMDFATGYGISSCLATKTSSPLVSWDASVGDLGNGLYGH
jgi:hypothetical protein